LGHTLCPIMSLYNLTHRVVVCYICKSCIIPRRNSQKRYLRAEPYRLLGNILSTTVQLLSNYNLRSIRELKEYKPRPKDQCQPIEYLASYNGFYYPQQDYTYYTRYLPKIKKYIISAYKIKTKKHKINYPWKECKL
jgi:hypothetical protein